MINHAAMSDGRLTLLRRKSLIREAILSPSSKSEVPGVEQVRFQIFEVFLILLNDANGEDWMRFCIIFLLLGP
jgi:hypothetical protein